MQEIKPNYQRAIEVYISTINFSLRALQSWDGVV